jgi:trimethylamine--corrinoid protein Co-methyltransferase
MVGRVTGLINVLTREEMQRIHDAAVDVLANVGMKIDHDEALRYLEAFGCDVDRYCKVVKFPSTVTEEAVEKMRTDHGRSRPVKDRMPMRYTALYFSTQARAIRHDFDVNTGGFCPFIYDLTGRRRRASLRDVRESIRLADALEHIDMIGLPCSDQSVPSQLRPVAMAAELVKHTEKLGGVEAWTARDVDYLTEIGIVVRGSEAELRQRPVLIGYAEARSPLCIDHNMADLFIAYVKRGFPQSLDTMPAGGTTAPVTSAGTLTLGIAETLGGLMLAYAIDEEAVISIDVCPTLTDMTSLNYSYAGADRLPMIAAVVQMITDFYGRPTGVHGGKTDACAPGIHAGIDKALSMIFPVLAGATGIGTVGHLENAVTFSPVQLVIDDEIVGHIKRMLRGFEVTEETLAVDVIKEVGIGGNYLLHESTARLFRRESWLSGLMPRMPWESWENQEIIGMVEKAKDAARKVITSHHPRPLSDEQLREIDRIVETAQHDEHFL